MRGYGKTSYGEAFADVYDEWYPGVSDIDATVALLRDLAGDGGRVLELGVGTGRLAIPMARAGLDVVGVDASAPMLERLRAADPDGLVRVVEGDMATGLPDGPFDAALIAYNTLFNLTSDGAQERCFGEVATRLRPGGSLVVEAFVPEEPFRDGDQIRVRSMTADQVVLSVEVYDAEKQTAEGHFVELNHGAEVRLRPWSIRYATVAQLDAMAEAAGLAPAERWADVARTPFDGTERHVSVYRR